MQQLPVDLRSDILTRPTEVMIAAMNEAARSPSGFGLREDSYVQRLEAAVAAMLGKEDALFCPTCTQANQIAIHLHSKPGQLVAAEKQSHIFTSEAGAAAALSGVTSLPIDGQAGIMDLKFLSESLGPTDALRSEVGLVWLENTHVRSGGSALPIDYMKQAADVARAANVPVHLDGARLANAAIALGASMQCLADQASSVSLSLNKGLGAPLGAVLAGSGDFIRAAETVRQRWGGGWRPAGIPAAAGLVALDGWETRLAADHDRAQMLAEALTEIPGVVIDVQGVHTNLLTVEVEGMDAATLVSRLKENDTLALAYSPTLVRLAIYQGIDDAAVGVVTAAFRAIAFGRFGKPR